MIKYKIEIEGDDHFVYYLQAEGELPFFKTIGNPRLIANRLKALIDKLQNELNYIVDINFLKLGDNNGYQK